MNIDDCRNNLDSFFNFSVNCVKRQTNSVTPFLLFFIFEKLCRNKFLAMTTRESKGLRHKNC